MIGKLQAVWQAYFESMRNAKFDNSTTLYVASGLLTYMNASGAPNGQQLCRYIFCCPAEVESCSWSNRPLQ